MVTVNPNYEDRKDHSAPHVPGHQPFFLLLRRLVSLSLFQTIFDFRYPEGQGRF